MYAMSTLRMREMFHGIDARSKLKSTRRLRLYMVLQH